jgi:Lrp/AsnC family leucine-responsive transcriptional regulator
MPEAITTPASSPALGPSALDSYDTRILAELQADARISMAELGRRVHLSQPAVTERVRKLEAAGVITGYRATVNLSALGYGIRAVIRVARAEYARVIKLIQQTPEVINAYNVTGEDSWILEIAVIDVPHLDAVVTRFCLLAETSTSIILNAPREFQPMLPSRPEDVKPPIRKLTKA